MAEKRFRTRCEAGDLIELQSASGTRVECVVLYASAVVRDLVLLGTPKLKEGKLRFAEPPSSPLDIGALVYTAGAPLRSGRWKKVGAVELFGGAEFLSLRTVGQRALWMGDELGGEPAEGEVPSFVPEVDCAGMDLVASVLSYLYEGSEGSAYARLVESRGEFVKRYAELPAIWERARGV